MYTNSSLFEYWSLFPILGTILFFLFVIDIILRAVALWRAARANQTVWFIALLLVNSMTILPIIYLMIFAKDLLVGNDQKKSAPKTTKRKKR